MIPLRDDVPASRPPVVTRALVVVCAAVFALQLGDADDALVRALGMVPARVMDPDAPAWHAAAHVAPGRIAPAVGAAAVPDWLTLLTCTFLHGGLLHFAGNMLFLWIFGDNVEDDLSHGRYFAFYLVTGLFASLSHVVSTFVLGDNPFIPSPGASGAISGVMGGYLVLHPHRRVRVIMFRMLTTVPGYVAVGLWFVFQLISALGVIGQGPEAGGGVAFMAHIGGFVAGVVLVKLFAVGNRSPTRRTAVW